MSGAHSRLHLGGKTQENPWRERRAGGTGLQGQAHELLFSRAGLLVRSSLYAQGWLLQQFAEPRPWAEHG